MKSNLHAAWVKTPGGGTYYFAVMAVEFLFIAVFFQRSPGVWVPSRLDAETSVTVLITVSGLLGLVYWSGRIERRKSCDANDEMSYEEKSSYRSSAHVLLNDWMLPPLTLWILALIVWCSLHDSFALPAGRVIMLITGISLLSLLYPSAQHLMRRRQ